MTPDHYVQVCMCVYRSACVFVCVCNYDLNLRHDAWAQCQCHCNASAVHQLVQEP